MRITDFKTSSLFVIEGNSFYGPYGVLLLLGDLKDL